MLKLINVIIGIFFLLAACATGSEQLAIAPGNEVDTSSGQNGSVRFLALGDSYTIGQSVRESERWPVLMVDDLRRAGKNVASAEIIARTGWTTRDLINRLEGNPPSQKYDIVSLLIGVNNQYQRRSIEEYETDFKNLLDKAASYAHGGKSKVFVLSIPDWGVTSYASGADRNKIAAEIDQFNKIAKDECSKLGISFIDITPISRTVVNDNSLLATDGLHYSGKMHQLWVNASLSVVKTKL
ncbi:SGNH/GDSL hydrolase family protein [Dyadobacter luteus]|uniref:SGNH/GDSL hydrolase family protein n=1 Tax=Dyadobacter luteus TaxID=2259619 RepID=A0A3D8Y902_9BACT|nr:SGNH/GDSL hydrolase family protein [Dyadobacter luteus]REA59740.1 SGNH/GDSL hydrolase family protein [Dyadobacter luteus]